MKWIKLLITQPKGAFVFLFMRFMAFICASLKAPVTLKLAWLITLIICLIQRFNTYSLALIAIGVVVHLIYIYPTYATYVGNVELYVILFITPEMTDFYYLSEFYRDKMIQPLYPNWDRSAASDSELYLAYLNEQFCRYYQPIDDDKNHSWQININMRIAKLLFNKFFDSLEEGTMNFNLKNEESYSLILSLLDMTYTFKGFEVAKKTAFFEFFKEHFVENSCPLFGLVEQDLKRVRLGAI